MILQTVRWHLAYALSYRDIEEMMKERGFDVDHSTIHRWVLHYSPKLEQVFHQQKRRCGSWRLNETYIKVKGKLTAKSTLKTLLANGVDEYARTTITL